MNTLVRVAILRKAWETLHERPAREVHISRAAFDALQQECPFMLSAPSASDHWREGLVGQREGADWYVDDLLSIPIARFSA